MYWVIKVRIILVIYLCICTSCASYTKQKVEIKFSDRQTLAFTGKGAAAGIMLDSVMGGVGVAIGIAIDEGIAKDIAKSIYAVNPDYDFLQVVDRELYKSTKIEASQKRFLTRVIVNRYGYRSFSVADSKSIEDGVSPWLSVAFECSGLVKEINYPEEFQNPLVSELSAVKTQGDLAAGQLSDAFGQVIDRWVDSGSCDPD